MIPQHLTRIMNKVTEGEYKPKPLSNSPERIAQIKLSFNLQHGKGKKKKFKKRRK